MKSGKFFTFKRSALAVAVASTLALAGTGLVGYAYAGTHEETANASATVVTPINLTAVNTLRFGAFSTNAADQTVTISNAGNRTAGGTSGGVLIGTNSGLAASFTVHGTTGTTFAITLPSTASVSIGGNLTSGTSHLAVNTFVSDTNLTGAALSSSPLTFLVGARVTTVASQVAGSYTGTFPVSVAYE